MFVYPLTAKLYSRAVLPNHSVMEKPLNIVHIYKTQPPPPPAHLLKVTRQKKFIAWNLFVGTCAYNYVYPEILTNTNTLLERQRLHQNFQLPDKNPAIFGGIFGIVHSTSTSLVISRFLAEPLTMFCRTLVGKLFLSVKSMVLFK
jgi:hypothetical protein